MFGRSDFSFIVEFQCRFWLYFHQFYCLQCFLVDSLFISLFLAVLPVGVFRDGFVGN